MTQNTMTWPHNDAWGNRVARDVGVEYQRV